MTDSTILQPEGLEQRYERYKEKIKTVKSWLRLLRAGFFLQFFVMKGV